MRQGFDWSLVRSFPAALDSGDLLGASRSLRTSQPAACYLLPPILSRMQPVQPGNQVELEFNDADSKLQQHTLIGHTRAKRIAQGFAVFDHLAAAVPQAL